MNERVVLSWLQKYAILVKFKSLSVDGGVEAIKQVQEWAQWKFELKKSSILSDYHKNFKKRGTDFVVCQFSWKKAKIILVFKK